MIKLILILVLLIVLGVFLVKYGEHKTELKLRNSDKKLKQYFYEII